MEKHEETRYVKRTQKITQCLLNYKLFKKLKGQLTVTESTKTYGIQNRTTVVKWLRKLVTLIGKTKHCQSRQSHDKLDEIKQKTSRINLWNDRPLLQIKKQSFLI
jgi:hypothetical protein